MGEGGSARGMLDRAEEVMPSQPRTLGTPLLLANANTTKSLRRDIQEEEDLLVFLHAIQDTELFRSVPRSDESGHKPVVALPWVGRWQIIYC